MLYALAVIFAFPVGVFLAGFIRGFAEGVVPRSQEPQLRLVMWDDEE